MIDQQKARALAEEWLVAHPATSSAGPIELCLLDAETIEAEFGWVFFYTSKLYMETGDFSHALAGNAPLIVDRDAGTVHVTGTAHPIEHYMNQYRGLNASLPLIRARLEAGLTIQGDVLADIHLFAAKEGGRYSATPPQFLACQFEFESQSFDCRLLLEEVGSLQPGSTARIPIRFLHPALIKPIVNVGDVFGLRDYRRIGEGRIAAIWPDQPWTV